MLKDSPILVTGISRSGASIIAGAINMCGAWGGHMAVSNSNKRGMFENIEIKESLVKPYLSCIGVDIEGQYPLPSSLTIPTNWGKQVEQAITHDGYSGGKWMYKDARLCLMWKIWNYTFPDAKWVIVRRRTGDILESCLKTGFMTAFKNQKTQEAVNASNEREGWLWMVHEYEKRFVEMINEGVNCKIIWPERMVSGDYKQLYELMEWLGLPWKTEVLGFIDSLLWGTRIKEKERRVV
jgi:hypothetical protein